MTVAIHPSQARPPSSPASGVSRLRVAALTGIGGAGLIAFAVGAFTFFSGLADPRARAPQVAPVASQWPDLKDGVPALAAAAEPALTLPRPTVQSFSPSITMGPTQAPRPPEPATLAQAAPPPEAAKSSDARAAEARAADAKPAPVRRPPPAIEPVATIPPGGRVTALVTAPRPVTPIAPARAETLRARAEPESSFVSLPAAGPKTVGEKAVSEKAAVVTKSEPVRAEALKPAPAKAETPVQARGKPAPERAKVASKPAPAKAAAAAPAAQVASAAAPAADEPELLGVKIPGGQQIREGWKAVTGLLDGKSDAE